MSDNYSDFYYISRQFLQMGIQMNKRVLHPAIGHLSSADIETVTAEYLAGEKVPVLISRFKIQCAPNQFRKVLPPRVLEQSCAVCSGIMVQDLPSRSYPTSSCKIYCSACLHEEGPSCRCQHCAELRHRLAEEERIRREVQVFQAVIAERERHVCSSYSVDKLPLSLAVAFLALSRCCLVKDGLYSRLDATPVPYAPTNDYTATLLFSLMQSGLIGLSEYSEANTISYKDSQLICDLRRVNWTGNIEKNLRLAEEIESCGLTGKWPEHWYAEVEAVWLKLALAECREFYDYCASDRGLQAQGDQAVSTMLANILRDFSVAQCYRIIWQGAKEASDFLVRKKTSRAHASNFMVGACQRWADRARAESWQVYPFRRNFELPRSMISYVLFDVILKIGERGFTDPILLSTMEDGSDNAW